VKSRCSSITCTVGIVEVTSLVVGFVALGETAAAGRLNRQMPQPSPSRAQWSSADFLDSNQYLYPPAHPPPTSANDSIPFTALCPTLHSKHTTRLQQPEHPLLLSTSFPLPRVYQLHLDSGSAKLSPTVIMSVELDPVELGFKRVYQESMKWHWALESVANV